MSYSLVNGAAINGSGGGDITLLPPGLDLLDAGIHEAFGGTIAGDAQPLEIGDAQVLFALQPDGIDVLDYEAHIGLHDIEIAPQGIDLVAHGTPAMIVNPVAGDASALDVGSLTLQIGTPTNARPQGLDLVLAGLHVASTSGVAPSDMSTFAGNARPLELGAPSVNPGNDATTSGGASPMELGAVAMGLVLTAGAAEPLEAGMPAIGAALVAGGSMPLDIGHPGISMAIQAIGIDLVHAGVHSVGSAVTFSVAGGASPLELGEHGPFGFAAITRQHFPMSLGTHAIQRGTSC